jgi:dUTP pyrophosphatase
MLKIAIKRLDPDLPLPKYETKQSAGMDLLAREDKLIPRGEVRLIPTGISIALPSGYEAQIRPRSGLALKHGLTLLNTPGTIDADYRGEIGVIMANFGPKEFQVTRGMRIAQMVIAKYDVATWDEVDELPSSERGTGGFGSTGI